MSKFLLCMLFISLTAQAQFEDFEDILAPSTLTPKIGIICKADVMFGTTDLVIDVKNGRATQVIGDKRYIYQVSSFACEKGQGDKGLKLSLKGQLTSVVDASSGVELKPEIKSSAFEFKSILPTKNGKDFKANSFELSSDVKFTSGSSFKIQSKTTNSTKCKLVKGGKLVKDLASNTSVRYAGEYNQPEVNNSDRGERKNIETGSGTTLPLSPSSSSGQ